MQFNVGLSGRSRLFPAGIVDMFCGGEHFLAEGHESGQKSSTFVVLEDIVGSHP